MCVWGCSGYHMIWVRVKVYSASVSTKAECRNTWMLDVSSVLICTTGEAVHMYSFQVLLVLNIRWTHLLYNTQLFLRKKYKFPGDQKCMLKKKALCYQHFPLTKAAQPWKPMKLLINSFCADVIVRGGALLHLSSAFLWRSKDMLQKGCIMQC